jgi:hypothetical protein
VLGVTYSCHVLFPYQRATQPDTGQSACERNELGRTCHRIWFVDDVNDDEKRSNHYQSRHDADLIQLVDGFTRDVSKIGPYGTGDLEIRISDNAQLAQAEPLLAMSYANS